MDAAWHLFSERGFAGTTVTQIEAAASLASGSGSFYRHFPSKAAVLEAAVDREVEQADRDRDLGPALAEVGGDPRVALAIDLQRRLDNLRRLRPLMVVLAREREQLGASSRRVDELLMARNLSVRSQRLAAWMDAGAIPRRDPEVLAATILSALVGYQLASDYFREAPAALDDERLIAMLVDLVLSG